MSDRIIVAKIKAKPFDIGIIQVYAPISERPEEEVEEFYEDLDKAKKISKISKYTNYNGGLER